MSARATAWAWDQQLDLASVKLVLLCLADSHDAHSGRVDSTLEHIAGMTGLSHKTIRASLAKLQQGGLVTPTQLTVAATGFSLGLGGGGG